MILPRGLDDSILLIGRLWQRDRQMVAEYLCFCLRRPWPGAETESRDLFWAGITDCSMLMRMSQRTFARLIYM